MDEYNWLKPLWVFWFVALGAYAGDDLLTTPAFKVVFIFLLYVAYRFTIARFWGV
jgi:hypothetical protein